MGHLLFFVKEAIFQCVAFSIQNTYKTLIHFILIDRLSAPSNLFHFLFCSTSFKANYSSNLNLRPMWALIIHIVIFLHRTKPQTGSFWFHFFWLCALCVHVHSVCILFFFFFWLLSSISFIGYVYLYNSCGTPLFLLF